MKREATKIVSMRLPLSLIAALQRAAQADDRSMSNLVQRVMRQWLAQQPGKR